MDLSGLSAIATPGGLTSWLQANFVTPVRPVASGSDLSTIIQKVIAVLESSSGNAFTLNKTAADVTGADPNFKIDLSAAGLPSFPTSIAVYIDAAGDGNYLLQGPVQYKPSTKILSGMISPVDFPNQLIKILVK